MSDNVKIRDHKALVDISFLVGPKSIKTEAKRLTLTVEEKGSSASFLSDSPPLWCAPCLMGQFPYPISGLGREPARLALGTVLKNSQECGISQESVHSKDRRRNEDPCERGPGRQPSPNVGGHSETCPNLLSDVECPVRAVRLCIPSCTRSSQ